MKKALSFLVALLLVCNFFPQAYADDGQYHTNLTGFESCHPSGQNPPWTVTENGLECEGYYENDIFYLAKESSEDFVLETDISTTWAAGLIIGAADDPYGGGLAIQLDASIGQIGLLPLPWPGRFAQTAEYQFVRGQTYHVKVVSQDHNIKVYLDDLEEPVLDYTDENFTGGRVGIYHNNGKTVVQNTYLSHFNTNLQGLASVAPAGQNPEWNVGENGLSVSGFHDSDIFYLADNHGKDFTFETDLSVTWAAGVAIHCGAAPDAQSHLIQLDATADKVRLIKLPFEGFQQEEDFTFEPGKFYHLKVVSQDNTIKAYLDDNLVLDYAGPVELTDGQVALYHNNGDTVYQNAVFTTADGGDGITPADPYEIKNAGFEQGKKNWTFTGDLQDQPASNSYDGKEGRYYVNSGVGPIWHIQDGKLRYSRSDTGDHLGCFTQPTAQDVTLEATLNLSSDAIFALPVRMNPDATQGFLVILTPNQGTIRFIQLPYQGELRVEQGVAIPTNTDFSFKMNLYDTEEGVKVEAFIDGEQVLDYLEKNFNLTGDLVGMFSFQGSGTVDDLKVYSYNSEEPVYVNDFSSDDMSGIYQRPGTSTGYGKNQGTAVSDLFTIKENYIKFLYGGTLDDENISVSVQSEDGTVLGEAAPRSENMKYAYIDVSQYKNQRAKIVIRDESPSGWLTIDSFAYAEERAMSDEVSLLESQVGYHPSDVKHAYLRSSYEKPYIDPTGMEYIVRNDSGIEVSRGEITYWGEKWGSYWWIADFSEVTKDGSYTIEVEDQDLISKTFQIRPDIMTNSQLEEGNEDQLNLVQIAMDQLDHRLKKFSDEGAVQFPTWDSEYIPGWRDCASEIRELSSHVVTVHALIDMYENPNIYNNLTEEYQKKLIDQITWGADYIVFAQESSENPLTDGRFNHDAGRQTNYGTTDFHNWHGSAYALTVLPRAYHVFEETDPELAEKYLSCAEKAYENAIYRPYNLESDLAGKSDSDGVHYDVDETEYVNSLARTVYGADSDWVIPQTLKTKDKLAFIWACTQLYEITGDETYFDSAAAFAASAAERQFTDFENPIDGVYGNFYAYEGNDELFELEWNQNHRFHMGNIEPTNLKGFMDLLTIDPTHPDAAKWYNVIKTYGDNYAKGTAELSPLGIYPLAMYSDPVYGGVKFFKATNHGATGMYGQIAKNFMQLGDFLGDNSYQVLANNNVEFVAGLNPGVPTSYDEYAWIPMSMIKGLGNQYFDAKHGIIPSPMGSGQNGFSADVQFATTPISATPDAPKGIINPDGSYQFNEDYLPHSHGYVSGVALLEGNYTLTIQVKNDGVPVEADVLINLDGIEYRYTTADGQTVITDLPVLQNGTVSVTFDGKTITHEIETIASGSKTIDVDFSKNISMTIEVPEMMTENQGKGTVTLQNLSDKDHQVDLNLSSDGVSLQKSQYTFTIGAGKTAKQEIALTAGYQVMPYAVLGVATVDGKESIAVGEGKVASSALREQKNFTVTASCSKGGSLDQTGAIEVLEGDSLTVIFTPDEGYEVKDVLVDGVSQGARGAYVFTNMQGNHTLQVLFQGEAPLTAQDIADSITSLPEIQKGDEEITLPGVEGFDISVESSSLEDIIGTDGSISAPGEQTEVVLVLRVTNQQNPDDTALTKEITVIVPAADIDTKALEKALEEASRIKESLDQYQETGKEEFLAAYEAAAAELEYPANQESVDTTAEKLVAAMKALVPVAEPSSRGALEVLLEEALKINTGKYTQESVDALNAAISQAQAVLAMENPQADEQTLAEALKSLNSAMQSLQLKEDPEDQTDPSSGIESEDPNAEDTNPNDPETGDAALLWPIALLLLCAGIGVVVLQKRTTDKTF